MHAVIIIIATVVAIVIAVTCYLALFRTAAEFPLILRSPNATLLAIGVLAVLLSLIFG